MSEQLNSYELSRAWFDFAFEHPEKISPNHAAIYFFAIEHCNRLGWKKKFGFPTQMAMDALGIKKHQTYIKYFNDLIEWGFFELVQKSLNQYSANIITIKTAMPKNGKALDKAIITHAAKQTEPNGQSIGQSNGQSIGSINKPINQEQINKSKLEFADSLKPFLETYGKDMLNDFYLYWSEINKKGKMRFELQTTWELPLRLAKWKSQDKKFHGEKSATSTEHRKKTSGLI
jgi:hypothetical protein